MERQPKQVSSYFKPKPSFQAPNLSNVGNTDCAQQGTTGILYDSNAADAFFTH